MDILKIATDWAKAEVFSAKISFLLGLLFFTAAIGFSQLGKTSVAKAFVWPLFVAGLLIAAVAAGLYYANKPRIKQFETAYNADARVFVQIEKMRTAKSRHDLALVFNVLPIIIIAAALLIVFVKTSLWRAIAITVLTLVTIIMFIDSNTSARNNTYHDQLSAENNE